MQLTAQKPMLLHTWDPLAAASASLCINPPQVQTHPTSHIQDRTDIRTASVLTAPWCMKNNSENKTKKNLLNHLNQLSIFDDFDVWIVPLVECPYCESLWIKASAK